MSSPASSSSSAPIAPAEWIPLDAYVDNLRRAAAGVVRVAVGTERDVACTGWLITDSLVVVPSYVLDAGAGTSVQCSLSHSDLGRAGKIEFLTESMMTAPDRDVWPALVRLDRSLPGAAQRLHLASARPGEMLLLLHYPRGVRDLQLSHGRLHGVGPGLHHDVRSAAGSSGAPLISAETGGVLGMHWGQVTSRGPDVGRAIPLAAMLDVLVTARAWPEIAEFHHLTALGPSLGRPSSQVGGLPPPGSSSGAVSPTSPEEPSPALLRAALTWRIDPEALDPDDRDAVRALVADPDASRWSLPSDERKALIRAAGSLEPLRSAYRSVDDPSPADRALERIVTGPPLDLSTIPEAELPYCLQAVGWLASVVPDLPEPAEINRELQRRRIRSRLRPVATDRLWGREAELARLSRWAERSDPPPLLVTGIGGMGKSALIARFVLDLPDDTVILWLDFDRPDLAPDDASSVLSALAGQLAVQRDGVVVPAIDADTWTDAALELGSALSDTRAVLVLDGFEVAQHAERHDELWGVLDVVLSQARGTRVIVSGRAPVPNLVLGGRPAEPFPLTGLSGKAARRWLVDRGIRDGEVLREVLRIADGVPLLLKLAVRLVEAGGDPAEVPRELPRELVDGYLYQRILDRVVNLRLRGLAHDSLVLRRITPGVLDAVLSDRLPGGLTAQEAVAGLTREMALVEALDQPQPGQFPATTAAAGLRLRPEVRIATLRLLEIEDEDRVREIDRLAAAWYAGPGAAAAAGPDTRLAAAGEAVYHYLRAGDVPAARRIWVEGLGAYLQGAERDIPERFPQARSWLKNRVEHGTEARTATPRPDDWEATALRRIRDALARGLDRTVPQILDERPDRAPDSPLIVYDAWLARERGDAETATRMLRDAGEAPGPAGWARRVVAARTAVLREHFREADALLDPEESSVAPPDAAQEAAVVAARIRLAVDLRSELVVADALDGSSDLETSFSSPHMPSALRDVVRSTVAPWDCVLAPVRRRLNIGSHITLPVVPGDPGEGMDFAHRLDELRERLLPDVPPYRRVSGPPPHPGRVGPLSASGQPAPPPDEMAVTSAGWVADLSVRRWWLVREGQFLRHVRSVVEEHRFLDQLQLSTAATLAALFPENFFYADGTPLVGILESAVQRAGATVFDEDAVRRNREQRPLLDHVAELDLPTGSDLLWTVSRFEKPGPYSWAELPRAGWTDGTNALVLLTCGPDPLEELERRVLGRPELKAK